MIRNSAAMVIELERSGLYGTFPLTLTFSPREREQQRSPAEIAGHFGHGGSLTMLLPLPEGEGRGEGKANTIESIGPRISGCIRSRDKRHGFEPSIVLSRWVS